MKKEILRSTLLLGMSLQLSACGGGGGGGNTSPVGPAPLSLVQIEDVVRSANTSAWAVNYAEPQIAFARSFLFMVPAGVNSNTIFPAYQAGTTTAMPAICPSGGSYTATWARASLTGVATNDYLMLKYLNCVQSNGDVYNGAVTTTSATSSSAVVYLGDFVNFQITTAATSTLVLNATGLSYTVVAPASYPHIYTTTGSLSATITPVKTASALLSGTNNFVISGINAVDNFSTSTTKTRALGFASNDGARSYTVVNQNPGSYSYTSAGALISANPGTVSKITGYQNITLTVASFLNSATVTGTNTDGSTITDTMQGNYLW